MDLLAAQSQFEHDVYTPDNIRLVRRICYNKYNINNKADVDDICQTVFMNAWRTVEAGRFRRDASWPTYIYRMAVNACLDIIRLKRTRDRQPFRIATDVDEAVIIKAKAQTPSPERACIANQQIGRIGRIVRSMHPRMQTVYRLRFEMGMTDNEVAAIMHVSYENEKNLVFRTRTMIKERV